MNFEVFFEDLKKSSLMKYDGVKYFGPQRSNYVISGDSLYFSFNVDMKNYTFDSGSLSIPNGNKKTDYHQLINYYLSECKKNNILGFEFNDSTRINFFFNVEMINPETLPYYKIQNVNKEEIYNVGVLMHETNNFENTNPFNYLKPVKVSENWYYYITYFKTKYD
ncbi:MAG: hypothetical protein IPL53_19775 [Ignavibacteria bacterium]|nr:hypothetical protein [Ignavibacteria bacterium]